MIKTTATRLPARRPSLSSRLVLALFCGAIGPLWLAAHSSTVWAQRPNAAFNAAFDAPGVTSLTNKGVKYRKSSKHFAILKAGDVEAVVVDNEAEGSAWQSPKDAAETPRPHRKGYNGLASLTHKRQRRNLFVPTYAGLNGFLSYWMFKSD